MISESDRPSKEVKKPYDSGNWKDKRYRAKQSLPGDQLSSWNVDSKALNFGEQNDLVRKISYNSQQG